MNIDNKRIQQLIIGFVFIILLVVVAAYFMIVAPLQKEVAQAKSSLETEEELLSILEQQNQHEDDSESEEEFTEYIQVLPGKPYIQHWMVHLEEIESSTDTMIESYSFSTSEYQIPSSPANIPDELEENGEQVQEQTNSTSRTVQQVNTTLTVSANSYEKLYNFLETTEGLKRLTKVNYMSISEPGESDGSDHFTLNVNLSTFYLPEMLEELPEYDFDSNFLEPSGKSNPF